MAKTSTYRTNRERIGRLNAPITVLVPVEERTTDGGPYTRYITWETGPKWAEANATPRGTSEEVIADRMTAQRGMSFRIRYRAEIDERYIIRYGAEDYEIESIEELNDTPRKAYLIIHAVRRNSVTSEFTEWPNNILMDYTQGPEAVTGLEWAITAGTLPDPDSADWPATKIHQLLTVNRASTVLQYGEHYTIDFANNKIVLTQKARGEAFLLVQKRILA